MLRIECPCCGLRDHDEFRYGGDASVTRPAHDDPDPQAWYDYVYLRV
ncbi:sarcosine oxidase subunit delta, partial [Mesorhizobium sp.]